ncbi:MAG: sodium:solute symporter family protein [Candidatus Omnitrophica bacterium]|nr:sodium:solute symporter family protein [Candidatus Omnitrophota bacterium]
MAFVLFIGYWASRRIHDTRDYIVAGGRLGWVLSIGTIFATWFGAETCMGSSSTAFNRGILGVIADPFGAGACLIISGVFFAKFFRSLNLETVVDYFEMRYGGRTAQILSLIYLPVYLGWVGAQLLAFGYILNSLTALPLIPCALAATIVVLTYTYLGGMWADTMSDFVQMIIIISSLFILFPILVKDLGGWSTVVAKTPPQMFQFYPKSTSPLAWFNYLQAWMVVGIGSLPAQDLFARTMAPRTPHLSRWASIIAGVMYITIGLLPVLLGIFGRIAFPQGSGEAVLIDLALKYLSPPLIAVMIGSLLAAIMSSADSALLAPSSIIGENILPSFKPDASEELKLKFCKLSVPVLGIISLVLAIYFKNVYRLCQESWGVLLTGVAAPMILGVYWRRANTIGAACGAIVGVAIWFVLKVWGPDIYPHSLIGFTVSMIVIIVVSLLTGRSGGGMTIKQQLRARRKKKQADLFA